jgi:hypothetical protein
MSSICLFAKRTLFFTVPFLSTSLMSCGTKSTSVRDENPKSDLGSKAEMKSSPEVQNGIPNSPNCWQRL